MAWVLFEAKLYRLPSQTTFSRTGFRVFQEKNRNCEVLIYAPEGGHIVVPILDLEYAGEEVNHELTNQ
ncbi:MAG: hypothetical protein DMG14_25950, partial [Acidobacteria bacterium]